MKEEPATGMLKISDALAELVRSHAGEVYPHECCGALLGLDGEVREIFSVLRLENRREDSPRNRFSVSAEDVLGAEQAARQQHVGVIGWYHSHPDCPPLPSEYDRQHAWPWYSYIIVGVNNAVPREMKSWRLREDRSGFDEEQVDVTHPSPFDPAGIARPEIK